jgi:hypothetical protein
MTQKLEIPTRRPIYHPTCPEQSVFPACATSNAVLLVGWKRFPQRYPIRGDAVIAVTAQYFQKVNYLSAHPGSKIENDKILTLMVEPMEKVHAVKGELK